MMTETTREEQLRSSLRKSAHIIQELQQELAAFSEPIAIVGMACRFPGGNDTPEKFWRFLQAGGDGITDLPPHRLRASLRDGSGELPRLRGGILPDVEYFDPAFFGISPREAQVMDPQHRLFLEVCWEALENARIVPSSLADRDVGVFVGVYNDDYARMLQEYQAIDSNNLMYAVTGTLHSMAAGRVAYSLGLTGPAITVDTACSSSLVALHQACQSLRRRECMLALAGGANLLLYEDWASCSSPSTARMFAPDGRCKTFDAAADGFVRSDGVGVVTLKRLSDAQADGDPIQAVILGSMINQDGRSSGLTAPNGPSQQRMIRRALAAAGVEPDQIGYVEAHGTGTDLGDPIELGALHAVFGAHSAPLWIGSVKTNFGHLEATAGIAGVMKVVLGLQHGQIPPHLHFQQPTRHFKWENSPLRVPVSLTDWPAERRLAGVSSFGLSGTNAHVIIGPAPEAQNAPEESFMPLCDALRQ